MNYRNMLKPGGIDKSTKCCDLTVYLVTGIRITGTYHIATTTSSAIRPSDALRSSTDGFIVLTDATIHEAGQSRQQPSILIRMDAVSHIDLPQKGWTSREAIAHPPPALAGAAR